ncbi:Hpt domain-containing protein [Stutzerimonas nosocomialis]|uniref:Hpt domain-containing protein n=1 Tax=Stutzerimonas nosocomialis TaxID=1056496 RepID=UPI001107DEC0|nr:Hpt domain-containing protein [Stutzerimonas nosocomialis]TLX55492.1 Hpt domain-containing protein [Stutzerimonas nosocomialis]
MSLPHLDSAVLATLQDVMEAEYPVLLETFLNDSQERLRSLHLACEAKDAEALRRAAHSFKGSCSNLGAAALSDLLRRLEAQAGKGLLGDAATLIEEAEHEFATVRALFLAERQRYGQP